MSMAFNQSLAMMTVLFFGLAGEIQADDISRKASFEPVITRGLQYIAKDGQKWIDSKKCVTCHEVTYMLWSYREAQIAGFKVDEEKLQEWTTWSYDWKSWFNNNRELKQEEAHANNPETLALFILSKTSPEEGESWKQQYVQHIIAAQLESGLWKAGGQLPMQKRPLPETQEVTTAWNLLAIIESGVKSPQVDESLKKGLDAFGDVKAGISTEWWATRYIIERKIGSKEKAEIFLQGLIERQLKDGGWGWLVAEESDALGTGLALFALSHADKNMSESINKAQNFLKNSQQTDGRWKVKSTLKRNRDKVTFNTSVWGSSWAVIGLSRTLSLDEN